MATNDTATGSLASQSTPEAFQTMIAYSSGSIERTVRLLASTHRFLESISTTLAGLTSGEFFRSLHPALQDVIIILAHIAGTAVTADLILRLMNRAVAYLAANETRQRVAVRVNAFTQKTTRMNWQDYVSLATLCPAMTLRMPQTRWTGSRLGVVSNVPSLSQVQTLPGAQFAPSPEYEGGHPYRRISRPFVFLHVSLFLGFAFGLILVTMKLGRLVTKALAYGSTVPFINKTIGSFVYMYTDHATTILLLSCATLAISPLLLSQRVHPLIRGTAKVMTWRFAQLNATFCFLALLYQEASVGDNSEYHTHASNGYVQIAQGTARSYVRRHIESCYSFARSHILTGLMFTVAVQAYYSRCKLELKGLRLEERISSLSADLANLAKKHFSAEQASKQTVNTLEAKLSLFDAVLVDLEAAFEAERTALKERINQLEEESNRLEVENGRLDLSFEDRVQTELEDRDRCIGGLRDKCERMKKEFEEAEGTLVRNAEDRVEMEKALQEQEAKILVLAEKLGDLQVKRALEKEEWERQMEEVRNEYEAKEVTQKQAEDEYRRAREKSTEDRKANSSLLQRQIDDLHIELGNVSAQRKLVEDTVALLMQQLADVREEVATVNVANGALEQIIKQWEGEVGAMDAMWKEVGLVSGQWEAARKRFNGLVAQVASIDVSKNEVDASFPNLKATSFPQTDKLVERSQDSQAPVSVYQVPAKRAPLYVGGNPNHVWPVQEEQTPSWISFSDESPSVPTHGRNFSFGQSHKPFSRNATGSRESLTRPIIRSGSGLKMNLGNRSSPTLSSPDFGRDIATSAQATTINAQDMHAYIPRGSLMESMHAPKRILTPVVCETLASGAVTTASEIVYMSGNFGGVARN